MNKRTVDGFTRISKRAAEKRYNAGEVVILCPVKLRPGFPFFPEIPVQREEFSPLGGDGFNIVVPRSRDFETVVNAFSFYALSNKSPMFIDGAAGEPVQVGYVITGKTDFQDDFGRWRGQYIDLWVEVLAVSHIDFEREAV